MLMNKQPTTMRLLLLIASLLVQLVCAAKNDSSITIALIGPYRLYNGLRFNGSLVTGGLDRVPIAQLSDQRYSGSWRAFWWLQQSAEIAVGLINRTPSILPNTTINIKRFDIYSPNGYYSGGSVMMLAKEIAEKHRDVVAVVGELYGEKSIFSAQVYSHFNIPFCGGTQLSQRLLNRDKYPYYFQTKTISGQETAIILLLKSWNVTRIALISDTKATDSSDLCYRTMIAARKSGIQVVAFVTNANYNMTTRIAQTLESVDARYIILCAGMYNSADIFYSLARNSTPSYGSDKYVWFTLNPPIPSNQAEAVNRWGKEFYKSTNGMIMVQPNIPKDDNMAAISSYIIKIINSIQKPYTSNLYTVEDANMYGFLTGFDCVGLLAFGMTTLLNSDSSMTINQLSSRQLQKSMNWTLYQDLNYGGALANPLTLSSGGDMVSPFIFGQLGGGLVGDTSLRVFSKTDSLVTKLITVLNRTAIFGNNGTIPPLDGPIYETIFLSQDSPEAATITSFFISGITLTTLFMLTIILFRTKPAVKVASATFLFTTTIGYGLSFTSNLFYFGIPTPGQCVARVWLQGTAFAFVVGSVGAKNARLSLIFNSRKMMPKWMLRDESWLVVVTGIVGLEQILLAIWASFSNVTVSTATLKQTITYKVTITQPLSGYFVWGYNILLYVALVGVTYRTRNIPPAHSEFSFLAVLCVIIPLGGLIVTSVSSSGGGSSTADPLIYFRTALMIWVVTIIPVLLQLLPILVSLYIGFLSEAWMEKFRNGKGSLGKASAFLVSKLGGTGAGSGSGSSFERKSVAQGVAVAIKKTAAVAAGFEVQGSKSNSTRNNESVAVKPSGGDGGGGNASASAATMSPNPMRKPRPLSIHGNPALKKSPTVKSYNLTGKTVDTYAVIITVENAFGWRTEWIKGSLAIAKVGEKAVCIFFNGADIQDPDSSAAFRLKDGQKNFGKVAGDSPSRLVVGTCSGTLIIDFFKPEDTGVFKNAGEKFLVPKN
ncbi:periplasmic binding protein-like I [Obelidium mucronatum]|nr:periplasmic binding protein-like I [Obelidium mucronatum]